MDLFAEGYTWTELQLLALLWEKNDTDTTICYTSFKIYFEHDYGNENENQGKKIV